MKRTLKIPAIAFLVGLLWMGSTHAQNSSKALEEQVQAIKTEAEQLREKAQMEEALSLYLQAFAMAPSLDPAMEVHWQLHFSFANYLGRFGAYDLALVEARKGDRMLVKYGPQFEGEIIRSKGRLGSYCLNAGMIDSAEIYFRRGKAKASLSDDYGLHAGAHNNLGYFYLTIEEPDSAFKYLNKALQLLDVPGRNESARLRYSIQDNLALLNANLEQYEQALDHYRKSARLVIRINNPKGQAHLRVQSQLGQASMLLRLGRASEAAPILDAIQPSLQEIIPYQRARYQSEYLLGRLNQYEQQKDWEQFAAYHHRSMAHADSLAKFQQELLLQADKSTTQLLLQGLNQESRLREIDMARQEEQLLLAEQQGQFNLVLLALVVVVFASAVLMILVYTRRRALAQRKERELLEVRTKLAESEIRNQELESDKLRKELDLKKKDLSDLAIYLANLREMHDEMGSKLQEMRKMQPQERQDALRTLVLELGNRLKVDQKTGLIQENIGQVSQEFYGKLASRFPTLTKSERELSGLLRLNLSNKEIAALKNVTPSSVKMGRYRLRKKLQLQPDQDIYNFLQAL